jgi:hypothetical protein
LNSTGVTRAHIGNLTINGNQMYSPATTSYSAQGSFVYSAPFQVTNITQAVPVQIWNNHDAVEWGTSGHMQYTSNGIQVWFIPNTLTPGNLPPVCMSNGRLAAGQMASAPAGQWPALYRDNTDRQRLESAIAYFVPSSSISLPTGPYDGRGGNDYYRRLSAACVMNALYGWKNASPTHLNTAKQQLLALFSIQIYGYELASSVCRAECEPTTDLCSTYGREAIRSWGQALAAACALGPNMANVLSQAELDAVSAHLYSFGINTVYNALTENQYYTADGGINMMWDLIAVTAGWNWNVAAASNINYTLVNPTHNECTYYIDGAGLGQYSIRYCQDHVDNKAYEGVGNSQCTGWFARYADIFKQWDFFANVGYIDTGRRIGLPALLKYARDHYEGQPVDMYGDEVLSLLLRNWTWQPGTAVPDRRRQSTNQPWIEVGPNPIQGPCLFTADRSLKPGDAPLKVTIFDSQGHALVRLVGRTTVVWDGRDTKGALVQPGMYLYRISVGGSMVTGEIIRIK